MFSEGVEILLWLGGFVVALIAYGIVTDPSRHTGKSARAKVAEDFIDLLDKGGPR
jgi:hypothetical protein